MTQDEADQLKAMIDSMAKSRSTAGLDPRSTESDHERRVRERRENLEREAQRQAGETFAGSSGIKASELSAADAVYMLEAQQTAQRQLGQAGKARNQDVYKALLIGSMTEINAAKDVRSRADAQGEVSAYNADKGGWVARYAASGSRLERAFHAWLDAELAK